MAKKALEAPSYKKVIKAIKKQRRVANKQRKKQQAWANQFYKDAQAYNLDVIEDLDEIRRRGMASADADRTRLEETFYPLEDEQISEINEFQQRAKDFDSEAATLKAEAVKFKSEAHQQYQAGKAVAGVGQAFAQERENLERALTDRGVNPSSGASQSLSAGLRLAEGAAQAAAGTTAADATRKEGDEKYLKALGVQETAGKFAEAGLGLQKGMVDVGRTYPAQILAEGEQARAAGAQGVDQTVAVADARTRASALAADWARIGSENTRTWMDAIDTGFRNKLGVEELRLKEQQLEAQESSGIGSALGVAASVARGFIPGLQEGGAVNDPNVSQTGGSTGSWSPTGTTAAAGQKPPGPTDIAPALLTPGEFVIPKHVVEWKGQEYFQNLLRKAPQQQKSMIAQTGATAGALTI